MRLYITGGGTGGHVTPGLAIARYFEKRQPDTVIRFAGSARGIENKLVPREGYPLDAIEIIGLSRSMSPKGILHNIKAAKLAVSAVAKAKKLLKAADKLSAYIKCVEELKAGNSEFRDAAVQTRAALEEYELPEVTYFLETFMPSFSLTLDQLK